VVSGRLPLGARPELDARLVAALERVGQAARVALRREARRRGLTPTQAQLLSRLRSEPAERRRVDVLAAGLDVAHPTVSDALSALVRKGLVTRGREGPDGRSPTLHLTPAGERTADELEAWHDPFLRALAARPRAEKEPALEFLLALIGRLQREGLITVARTCTTCRFFRPDLHAGPRPHYCALLERPLGTGDLRVDCPEHQHAA
jgi:DNA-binding MarR family transcriptional regulator